MDKCQFLYPVGQAVDFLRRASWSNWSNGTVNSKNLEVNQLDVVGFWAELPSKLTKNYRTSPVLTG